ncbi:conserved hypothetical protein [Methanolacinia petrolearia DSM 11571]|uniref:Uncharacterized protein n=1 Tax=Methanolacinia petrolearia (strain DSM 11571 / OCM 486 / SEBR 4847) TaxID=679926 RepID=E1RGR8_METP4|nr:hypothetical protein [Methanolacinia petrolearia]ADN36363.1 conserved hypothetical protein [Methanolacinia petrolearia DSM 11571]
MTDSIELAELADQILDIAEDNYDRLSSIIDDLDDEVKNELLVSDFLHAFQVFYYYFRMDPSEIVIDRLMLQPASSLEKGVFIENFDIFELWFIIEDNNGIIYVSDGEKILRKFSGRKAYTKAVEYANSLEW